MKSRPLLTVEEVVHHPVGCFVEDKTKTVVHGGFDLFLEEYGREGAEQIMLDLCFLISEVQRITIEILAKQKAKAGDEPYIREVETNENAVTQKLGRLGSTGI